MYMLTFLLLSLFYSAHCAENELEAHIRNGFSQIQDALQGLTEETAPQALKALLLEKRDENSHFCCKIDPPVTSFEQTRVVSQNIVLSGSHTCGYTGCGLWGWSSCSVKCTTYWMVTQYHTEQYTVYQQTECPQAYITCCTDYFFVLGHCLHLTELANNLELLQQLQQQGIVIPGLTGK